MNFPNIITTPCIPTTPPPLDPRCADPAFAKAYPDICSTSGGPSVPVLVLKPGTVLSCALSAIQFNAFVDQNGTETQIASGVMFVSSNPAVLVVGGSSGAGFGISAGTATVTATYNGLTATSTVTVIGTGDNCCGTTEVATMLVVDVSKSMTQAFGGAYATKEDFAIAVASQYASQTNIQKDIIGLIQFDTSPTTDVALPFSPSPGNATDVETAASGLSSALQLTSIGQALQAASTTLLATTAQVKVIVLISDGQDNDPLPANAPIPIAEAFENQGGIILCIGVRASASGFNLLNGIATGGFFINAYPANVADALNTAMQIKGYFCAGNCIPPGDSYQNEGALNYSSFLNWNVTAGCVNLIGNGFLDVLPGNGLYVSLACTQLSPPSTLTSKTAFLFASGKQYNLVVYLAGDQQNNGPIPGVQLKIGDGTLLNANVAVTYLQGFTRYSFNFSVLTSITANISITQLAGTANVVNTYSLLKSVELDDVTDSITMFSDNFNEENLQYVPPACGASVTIPGYYGYACYGYGCLSSPPPAQIQDPNPLPDIETGYVPPATYTSIQSFTATCPSGSVMVGPASVVPIMTSATAPSGTVTDTSETVGSEGWRAFGNWTTGSTTTNGWQTATPGTNSLTYQFATAQTVLEFVVTPSYPATPYTSNFQVFGSNDGVTFTPVTNPLSGVFQSGVRQVFAMTSPGAYLYYKFVNTPTASQTFGIGLLEYFSATPDNPGITKSATYTSTISQQDAINNALAQAQAAAAAALSYAGCAIVYTSTETASATCPCGTFGIPNTVSASASATSFVSQQDANAQATAAALAVAQAQLNCTASNNTSPITINDAPGNVPTAATPYPSVLYYPTTSQTITKVTVSIFGFAHTYPQDVSLLLVSPSGKAVILQSHCGGNHSVSGVNLVFDDAAGSNLPFAVPLSNPPSSGTIVSGTFKPTEAGGSADVWPKCAPQSGYLTTLASFIGDNPSGAWSLWVIDDKFLDVGQIAGGWTLTITPQLAPVVTGVVSGGLHWTWGGSNPPFWSAQYSSDGGITWTVPPSQFFVGTLRSGAIFSAGLWSVIGYSAATGGTPVTARSNTIFY